MAPRRGTGGTTEARPKEAEIAIARGISFRTPPTRLPPSSPARQVASLFSKRALGSFHTLTRGITNGKLTDLMDRLVFELPIRESSHHGRLFAMPSFSWSRLQSQAAAGEGGRGTGDHYFYVDAYMPRISDLLADAVETVVWRGPAAPFCRDGPHRPDLLSPGSR